LKGGAIDYTTSSYFGNFVFAECESLEDVYCFIETTIPSFAQIFLDSYPQYATLHVVRPMIDSYKTTASWKDFGNIVSLTPEEMGLDLEKCQKIITFADSNVKNILVPLYDYDGDGELSEGEVEYVNDQTFTKSVFSENNNIESFDELKYFTGLTKVSPEKFLTCNGLTSVIINEGSTIIGYHAFLGCTHMTSVTIPSTMQIVGDHSFQNCSSLTSITIPSCVSVIGSYAFGNCDNLTTVTVGNETPVAISENVFSNRTNATLYVPEGCKATYQTAPYWNEFKEIIEDQIITFADATVKALCVAKWDTNGDGELSQIEAMAVKDLGDTFCGNSTITTFNELQYFTGLTSIGKGSKLSLKEIPFWAHISEWGLQAPKRNTITPKWAIGESTDIPYGDPSVNAFADLSEYAKLIVTFSEGVPRILLNRDVDEGQWNEVESQSHLIDNTRAGWSDRYFTTNGNMITVDLKQLVNDKGFAHLHASKGANWENVTITSMIVVTDDSPASGNNITAEEAMGFSYCSSLSSITIPANVNIIGDYAFLGCSGLSSLNIPNSVTFIGDHAFSGCSGLTSEEIPNSVISIGDYAFNGCSGLTSVNISSSVANIGNKAFYGCSGLKSVTSQIKTPFAIDNSCFSTNNATWTLATLFVPADTKSLYKATDGWKNFKTIKSYGGVSVTLKVIDENNNDITNKVSIVWQDANGNIIGKGQTLGGAEDGANLYYSVELNEVLGRVYHEVKKQKVTADDETLTCKLEKIPAVTLTGQVLAYGTALPRVKVNLTQWLNGKYEYEASTLTDADGKFSLDAYNDTTVLIVTANGYIDNKITRRNLNNGSDLGEIDMTEVQGKVVKLDMSYQEATREGGEPIVQSWYRDTRNIDYSVRNVTKGKDLDDFAIQSGNIVLPTGTDRGDKIQVTVRSLNDKFAEVTAEGTIADNDSATVTIQLLAFGGIEATYGQKADDQLLAMLYDNAGKLQMRTVCATSRLTFSNLASGSYTLVTMGYNGAIGSVSDISDLANLDLVEGVDYVRSTATVHDGVIATVNVVSVPELDASKFEYTGMNTYFTPNKTQLMVGNYITLSTRLDFKEQYADKIDHATIVIDIPEGCEFVANSVVIGTKPLPHSLDGNKLKITVDKDDIDNRIRFCVIPKQSGKHITSALAEFDYKGMKAQPMGQIQFEGTVGEVYVPSTTKKKTITVGGIGIPKADVEVYDNEALIGTTKSLGNGKWSITCELPNSYNFSYHNIYVKYRGEGNVVGRTESKKCIHDINAIVPKTVTMVNTAHPAGNLIPKVYETVFNYETVMAVQNYYLYWPEYPDFTFLIDLSENDTTKVSDVNLYIHTTDGDKRKIHAYYNEKLNRFVATSSFDMYSLPVNVSLTFHYDEASFIDDIDRSNDEYTNIEKVFTKLESYIEDNYEITNITDDNSVALFEIFDKKSNTNQLLEVELINPQSLNINDFTLVTDGTNDVTYYLMEYIDNNSFEAIVIEEDLINAYKIRISSKTSSNAARSQKRNIRRSISFSEGAEFAANAFIPFYEYLNGTIDYNFWKDKLPTDDEEITIERNKAFQLLISTCPNGKYKLSSAWMSAFWQSYQQICDEHSAFSNNGYEMLEIWRKELLKQFAFESATMGIGKALKFIPNIKVFKTNSKNAKYWQYLVSGGKKNRDRAEAMIENGIGKIGGFMEDQNVDLSISQRFSSWEPREKSNLIRMFRSLQADIKSKYQNCEKEDDDDDNDKDPETEPEPPINDPSGFVYEAVPTNRIEGVKATVYYSENEDGAYPIQWDAAEYGQINPQITDESGLYAWDVPLGFWKVIFEKEGYETAQTDWLPVPPPQLEVNIPMSQAVAPFVENAMGAESGITLDFSKYMKPNTLTKSSRITVTCNGEKAKGDVELLNLEENPYNKEEYASKIKFVPNTSFKTTDEVIITVKKEVESYAGKEMTEDFVQRIKIESEITEIACDSVMAIDYQGTGVLELSVLPAAAAKGRTVQVASTSTMIASTDVQSVTLNDEGKARITVSGELPGNASLHLSIPEAGKEKYVAISVVTKEAEVVKTPKASKLTGSSFENNYMLTLTCATKGATIYYTLDGSCPCDEQTRKKYTGPITLPEGQVTLQVIAVREGMADSDVATFNYTVTKDPTGIKVIEEIRDFEAIYQDGSVVVTGAKGASCHIYDLQGREMATRLHLSNQATISVPKTEVYVVSVKFDDGQTVVKKVVRKQ
jgi:hypothetical protein